jgi:hypothetical protein
MECDGCTICCLDLNIPDTNSKEGDLCKHCNENVGCKIYDTRPECCKAFECCWKQTDGAHIDLRPDKCGVLFEKWTDNVIVGSLEKPVSDLILRQISYFQSEGISVVLINQNEKSRTFYLADNHTIKYIEGEIINRWQSQLIPKI